MATSKLERLKKVEDGYQINDSFHICECCSSSNIKETRQGHICGDCGLVLSSLVMEYHQPYERERVQTAPRGKTQIGLYKERVTTPQSVHLQKLQQLDSERSREEEVEVRARSEIKRILTGLRLS